jgi:TonB family protein
MAVASRSNNLTDEDTKPWHLRATFKLLDDQGNTTDEGTYEEFWGGPKKNKVTYTVSKSTCTDYRTEQGLQRKGDLPAGLVISTGQEFVQPLPNREAISHESFELQQRDAGNVKLNCLKVTGLPANPGLNYCLDSLPALRVSVIGFQSLQVLHNQIQKFQGHYVAGDLQFLRGGMTILTAHLETIEALDPLNENVFTPPPDAKLVPLKFSMSAGVAQGMLVKKIAPEYPLNAKQAGMSGTVVLQALIGRDGHIADLRVVSGNPVFQKPALDAVRNWIYRPFLINGEPVEVNTTINVVFMLPTSPGGDDWKVQ